VTLRALVVDDEPAARRGLRRKLAAETDLEVVGECGDGASAIAAIGELAPDLVFLDVQMPEVGGFDVVDAVGLERMPAVVFVTAYDRYAVRAFDVHAIDYVLKPVDGERLRLAVRRVREHLRAAAEDATASRLRALLADVGRPAPPRWAKRLAIKSPGRVTLVDVADVARFEAAGNYVEVHAGAKVQLLRETMASLESRLDPERFVRVSRSAIVSVERVRELQPLFNGDFVVILKEGTQVAGSRRYRAALDRLLAS
jgi:two-component system LytT family response regulator